MVLQTNPLGLLCVDIDSSGSLRLIGDRVVMSRSAQSERVWVARQKVTRYRALIAGAVHAEQGIVAHVAGDRLMCQLPSAPAVIRAAHEVMTRHAREEAEGVAGLASSSVDVPIDLRAAAAFGPLAVDGGDVSGEVMTIAEALARQATADEVLVDESLYRQLSEAQRAVLVPVATLRLSGVERETQVYQLNWATTASGRGRAAPARAAAGAQGTAARTTPTTARLHLQYMDREVVLDAGNPTITLRSGPEHAEHARIALRDGVFVLENLNIGGTRVLVDGQDETTCVNEMTLTGAGAISLGVDFVKAAEVLRFRVVHAADRPPAGGT